MGKKDASATKTPVDQYRKQIGRQDYKKNKPVLKATRLKAEAKKTAIGIKEVFLVVVAILVLLLAFYAFFYLKLTHPMEPREDSED
ncbi:triple QxxK/R motif-containing protein [Rana temporaria]|uniref:triple QxxK/R motif-containing protein n=1 Tax=Rana temporaria TaxID=8407 RepID=UPI001AAC8EE9|nr:triple QxxK/R motif-containing protein [Rana temporaria]XP_040210568.1 triple QxxK/R motif-containing protein [Rana temporaria]XP_040210569.1 triple QxxK/R motif-containing protein [Rana temporaria]